MGAILCAALRNVKRSAALPSSSSNAANGTLSGDCKRSAAQYKIPLMARKNPAAVALGRKGGQATAEKLSQEERRESARRAARARWARLKKLTHDITAGTKALEEKQAARKAPRTAGPVPELWRNPVEPRSTNGASLPREERETDNPLADLIDAYTARMGYEEEDD